MSAGTGLAAGAICPGAPWGCQRASTWPPGCWPLPVGLFRTEGRDRGALEAWGRQRWLQRPVSPRTCFLAVGVSLVASGKGAGRWLSPCVGVAPWGPPWGVEVCNPQIAPAPCLQCPASLDGSSGCSTWLWICPGNCQGWQGLGRGARVGVRGGPMSPGSEGCCSCQRPLSDGDLPSHVPASLWITLLGRVVLGSWIPGRMGILPSRSPPNRVSPLSSGNPQLFHHFRGTPRPKGRRGSWDTRHCCPQACHHSGTQ